MADSAFATLFKDSVLPTLAELFSEPNAQAGDYLYRVPDQADFDFGGFVPGTQRIEELDRPEGRKRQIMREVVPLKPLPNLQLNARLIILGEEWAVKNIEVSLGAVTHLTLVKVGLTERTRPDYRSKR